MPFISKSTYKPPSFLFKNPHVNTIYPALFRSVKGIDYKRERIETPDGDFLDLDWSRVGSRSLLIAKHGLEGSADRPYMRGIIKAFNDAGFDGLAFNFRGCSGEPNRLPQSYHMGWTNDLEFIINELEVEGYYRQIILIGFSLGGSVVLNYLGQQSNNVSPLIKGAVTFSVPVHIPSTNVGFNSLKNKIYLDRFMQSLNAKTLEKAAWHPELKVLNKKKLPKSFNEFDNLVTGPIHGFEDGEEYWEKCSSIQILNKISVPTLLVNAQDDTFLSDQCYPKKLAKSLRYFYLETPQYGGHVGFTSFGKPHFWSEQRAVEFIKTL